MGQSYRDLIAWQKAMKLAADIYRGVDAFPKHELYGLTQQIRRAAVSIPSNIAEGQARHSQKEFMHFLSIARGSIAEVQTQLLLSAELGYLSSDAAQHLVDESAAVCMVVNRLYASINARVVN